ncbi:hypothetical protein KAS50_00660, partial [bacterium]|nr:hypothetical protein [bacterium]
MNPINKNIFYVSGIPLDEYKKILHDDSINITEITTINKSMFDTSLSLFFVTQEFVDSNAEQIIEIASDSFFFSTILVIDGGTEPASDIAYIDDIIQKPLSKIVFLKKIKKYFSELHARFQTSVIKKELELRTTEIKELS